MSTKTIRMTDGIDTILPESAESGSGYVKMADGTLICYGGFQFSSLTPLEADGNLYCYKLTANITFPIQFISSQSLTATVGNWSDSFSFVGLVRFNESGISSFKLMKTASGTIYGNKVNWIAIGRWK